MGLKEITIIVPGGLNTDIIGLGVPQIISQGELSWGGQLCIGPGGKSRNVAQMISVLISGNKVAMIGKTSKDSFGLWEPPVRALKESGVNTEFVKILNFAETNKYPGIALIPVDKNGHNQIYVLPGINDDFFPNDIEEARVLFENAQKNNGILALSLELPMPTAIRALELAREYGLKSILDPGGITPHIDHGELLNQKIFLIKPNKSETKILTGVDVVDITSAKEAAQIFFDKGIQNVLITVGKNGAYFFDQDQEEHIPVPDDVAMIKDETGCGDQTMATICAYLSQGKTIDQAIKRGVISGHLQFHKAGIQPITEDELNNYMKNECA